MYRQIIFLLVICAIAYAGIQPLKMDNTSLTEHIKTKHLAKREVFPWWEEVVDVIFDWLQQVIFHLGMFGYNYKGFSDGMKNTFKDIFGVKY
ncbi:hypothetical protein KQX54_018475 [Cotesia glomerata]|uniref:Salivary secreted peptide n=1 Tax=Cotesia glomerata TaxID=32391 RepID=A0AAV7I5W6_COTGL|nr:hypothetical protein KQX54_018475 [Cotesia glomerata]